MAATNSYDIENKIISLSDAFKLMSLPQTPFLNEIKFGGDIGSTTHKWDDDKMVATGCKTTAAYAVADGTITVDDVTSLRVDMILQIDLSLYRVSSINTSTKVVTIAIVTGDANHASGSEVKFINNSRVEGSDYQDSDRVLTVERTNYTQIMTDYINVTGTAAVIDQRHFKDEVKRQAEKKLERLRFQLNRAILMGIAYDPGNNSGVGRLMGGVRHYINANGYVPAQTTFSADNLDAFLEYLANKNSFKPTALWMNPTSHKKFNALHADKIIINNGSADRGEFVDKYLSGIGLKVDLKTDSDIPVGEILALNTADVQVKPLRNRSFFAEELAKTGDARKFQIVGEYTSEYNNSAQHGIFKHS